MAKIIGIIVVFASVLGGYVLSHGKIAALIQPFEVMIIGGAAFGAFLQANPGYMTMHVLKKSLSMFGALHPHLLPGSAGPGLRDPQQEPPRRHDGHRR
jgi:chemotaxis protein MotA